MSTKIYNGYKIKKMNLLELDSFFMDLRNKILEKAKEICVRKVAIASSRFISAVFLESFEYIPKEFTSDTSEWKIFNSARKTVKDIYDQDKRLNCSLIVYPRKKDILATFYSIDGEFTKIFEDSEFVEEYGYWNNTDPLETVSKRQWNKRKKDWEEVFTRNKSFCYIPSKNGITCDILDRNDYYEVFRYFIIEENYEKEYLQNLIANIPSSENRIKEAAYDICVNYFIKTKEKNGSIDIKDYWRTISEVKEWMNNTDEGKKYYTQQMDFVRSKIPENITEEHLQMLIPLTKKDNK